MLNMRNTYVDGAIKEVISEMKDVREYKSGGKNRMLGTGFFVRKEMNF